MTIESALEDINNAILDLQIADHNTYQRPVRKLAVALNDPELRVINEKLKKNADFEFFIHSSEQGGSMVGSAQLNWPDERELELGLTIQIIERAGSDPEWLQNFAFEWYYDGNNFARALHKLNRSVFIPFARDYKAYLAGLTTSREKKSDEIDVSAVVGPLEHNRVPIVFVSKQIIYLIEEMREKIRGDNKLSQEERAAALEGLEKLEHLSLEAETLSESSPDVQITDKHVQSWLARFKSAMEENFLATVDPKNLANAAVPTGLILGCGALGALIAGPAGFGAGSLLGHLITGQIKPGAAAKTIEDVVSSED